VVGFNVGVEVGQLAVLAVFVAALVALGVWRWAEHRAQWMRARRPAAIGDGSEATTIFRWSVPLRVGAREAQLNGVLEWVPDVRAVRA
jgi:hypothetical protein